MFFKTKSSTYYVDEKNKTIWGGAIGDAKTPYSSIGPVIVGEPVNCSLVDGRKVITSVVCKVNGH